MSKEITHDDIQVGDTILVSHVMTVAAVTTTAVFNHTTSRWLDTRNAVIELIDRTFNLPTQAGSVVVVNNPLSPSSRGATWLLRRDGFWHSEGVVKFAPSAFAEFLRENELTHEVIR